MNNYSNLQIKMLQMMKWFHEYCNTNHISYYMIGGTMLGAARHQGFIPWDDDIDIGVPRKDYDRLLEISHRLMKEHNKYIIESWKDGNPDYQYAYAKVYDTSTTLIENKRVRTKRGLFIDVFPLDGIGDDETDALNNFKPIKKQLNLLTLKTSEVRKGRSWTKNMIVRMTRLLPKGTFDVDKILMRLDYLCRVHPFESSNYVGNLIGMWRERELMPRAAFGVPTLYNFEDTMFYGVENADLYLSYVYNNWRKLPPTDKQVSQHDFIIIDLEHSYLNNDEC